MNIVISMSILSTINGAMKYIDVISINSALIVLLLERYLWHQLPITHSVINAGITDKSEIKNIRCSPKRILPNIIAQIYNGGLSA